MTEEERLQFWRRKNGVHTPDITRSQSRLSSATSYRTSSTSQNMPVYYDSHNESPVEQRMPPVPSQRYTAGSFSPRPNPFAPTHGPDSTYPEESWSASYSSPPLTSPQGMGTFPWPPAAPLVRSQPGPAGEWYESPRLPESRKHLASAPRGGGRTAVDRKATKKPSEPRGDPSMRSLNRPKDSGSYAQVGRPLPRAPVPSYLGDPFALQVDTMQQQPQSQPPLHHPHSHHGGEENIASSPSSGVPSAHTPISSYSMGARSNVPSNLSFHQTSFPRMKDEPSPDAIGPSAQLRGRSRSSRTEDFSSSLSVTHPFPCTFPKCGARLKDRYEWKRHEVIHVRADVWFCMPDNSAVIDGKCAFCESDDISPRHFVDHNLSLCWAKPAHERAFHRKVRSQYECFPLFL